MKESQKSPAPGGITSGRALFLLQVTNQEEKGLTRSAGPAMISRKKWALGRQAFQNEENGDFRF
ncbi:hypothetical protein ACP26L_00795 [Paenibacillus sp. S-38]|uniref:hypothetical protein n=1 Tax=Paenibacillus sp. S-38 TaxID=3416710 RepID=UPI003CEB48E9